MRRSLASGAGPPETGARSRCLASRNAMRRLSRRSRSSVIRIIATAIRTPPTTGAARTMAYLIISPPTISRHDCGPNGLPAGGSWLLGTGRYAVPADLRVSPDPTQRFVEESEPVVLKAQRWREGLDVHGLGNGVE